MINYLAIVQDSIEFIDNNIGENYTLNSLSKKYSISEAHYSRIFKFFTGTSIKKYIIGRKLLSSLAPLRDSQRSIIDIALDLGFNYPEVYSRSFKKKFGASPNEYRKGQNIIVQNDSLKIIEKDVVNCNGKIILKSSYIYLDSFTIYGTRTVANIKSKNFLNNLIIRDKENYQRSLGYDQLDSKEYFHTISCLGDGENFELFYGNKTGSSNINLEEFQKKEIESSWYITFKYDGELSLIYKNLRKDIEKSFKEKNIPLVVKGVGLIILFDSPYSRSVKIFVPVERN